MERIKQVANTFIILFSEALWLYYLIVIFTSARMDEFVSLNPFWWGVAGALSYLLNILLVKRTNITLSLIGNIVLLGMILIMNWVTAIPSEAWTFGTIVSLAVLFVWVRSANFRYQKPQRLQIMRSFEVNLILYVVFAFILLQTEFDHQAFHMAFIFAIAASLIGMILSLQNHADHEGAQLAEIRKVGHSSSITGWLFALFAIVPLLSLFFLLPAWNQILINSISTIWKGIKWFGQMITEFFIWLSSILPPASTGELGGMEPAPAVPMTGEEEQQLTQMIPVEWFLIGGALVGLIIAIMLLVKVLKNQPRKKSLKTKRLVIEKESWWANFQRHLKALFQRVRIKCLHRFPSFYRKSVYWYYYQLQKWGKKNGFPAHSSETSQEYIQRIIEGIRLDHVESENSDQPVTTTELLFLLNRDYQAAYYGGEPGLFKDEYPLLLKRIRGRKRDKTIE